MNENEILEQEQPNNIKEKRKYKFSISDISFIAMFSSLIAICSWISIPFVVPFTLQTFAVFLALIVLGGFKGTMSILVYIILGIIGLPVFAGFNGGIAYLLGPTGGYIVGFLFTGLIMWALEKPIASKNKWFTFLSMTIGLLVCYLIGTIWFGVVYTNMGNNITVWKILMLCVIPFIIPDVLKMVLVLIIKDKLKKVINKY